MKEKKKIDEIILLQYVEGGLKEEERREVEEWISHSKENRLLAEDYFYLSFAVSSLETMMRATPEKALQNINKRILKRTTHQLYPRLQQIAAILFLPLLVLSGYLLFHPEEKPHAFYLETRMTPGMIGSTILPDGTKVWLNSTSCLKYPTVFSEGIREVELDGEAYFQVTPDSIRPFIVHTEKSSVTVLGTEFNIDAYSYNNFIAATLVDGSVVFDYKNISDSKKSIRMEPGEQIIYDKQTSQTRKNDTYVPKDIAWKDGQIILKETPLSEIMWILTKRFNVEFKIKDPALYQQSFTGIFTNQQLERVLEHFKISSGIRYHIDYLTDGKNEITKNIVTLY